jgi:hypothetical protein
MLKNTIIFLLTVALVYFVLLSLSYQTKLHFTTEKLSKFVPNTTITF